MYHDILVDAPPEADLARVDRVFLRKSSENFVSRCAGSFGHGGLRAVGGEADALRD